MSKRRISFKWLFNKRCFATTARLGHFLTNQGPLYAHLVQREHFPKHMPSCKPWRICPAGTHISRQGTNSSDRACSFCQKGKFTSANSLSVCKIWRTCSRGEFISQELLQHQIEHAKYAIAAVIGSPWTALMDLTARMGSDLNVLWDGMGNFWLRIML